MDMELYGMLNVLSTVRDSLVMECSTLNRVAHNVYSARFPEGSKERAELEAAIRSTRRAASYLSLVDATLRGDEDEG